MDLMDFAVMFVMGMLFVAPAFKQIWIHLSRVHD